MAEPTPQPVPPGSIRVSVACVEPGAQWLVPLVLPAGSTVADAVERSGLLGRVAAPSMLAFAVFGRRAEPADPLVDGDRVELTRPLAVDAMTAWRLRAKARPVRSKSSAGHAIGKPSA